jgi:outer membrane protein assembly factor BamD (BamD/ComL family)
LKKGILIGSIIVIVCLAIFGYFSFSGKKESSIIRKQILLQPDGSLYKRGLSLAVDGKNEEALTQWQSLINEFPDSDYVDEALRKSAEIYLKKGDILQAEQPYKKIRLAGY